MKKSIYYGLLIVAIMLSLIMIRKFFSSSNNVLLADVNIKGDVDGNGKVGSSDYLLVKKHIMNLKALNDTQKAKADVNGDSKISSADYIAIKKIIMSGSTTPVVTPTPTPSGYENKKAKVIDSKYTYTVANYNVLDYGADPTGVKDSSDAFIKALADATNCIKGSSKQCGGTVYAPKGKYLITKTLHLTEYASLIGDLEEGTTNGTILMIKHGAGTVDNTKPAILVECYTLISNIVFWYPDQRIDGSGNVISYPPTVQSGLSGAEGMNLENLYFVNSYTAIDFAHKINNAIMFIRNIYGTPLHIGIENDKNLDTMKMSNINFSSKYWLNSGLSNIPSKASLLSALKNANTKPTGIVLESIDFFFLAKINIENYYRGISFLKSPVRDSPAIGSLYDANITDCYYPIYVEKSYDVSLVSTNLQATGGSGATAFYVQSGNTARYSINSSTISSTGANAIYYGSSKPMSIVNSKVNGKITKDNDTRKIAIVGSGLTNTGIDGCSVGSGIDISKVDYDKIYVTKPKSKNLIMIEASEKTDITSKIKDAVSKLKSTGGIVYIPSGVYYISGHIDVASGIEIRGIAPFGHLSALEGSTVIETTYKGDTLFTLQSGSGINGLQIRYPENRTDEKASAYPYAIKGNGSNVYVRNVGLISAWNGIDFSSVRCDNHYIEHIWGSFFNIGISVGAGSSNGVIRDNHFTTNVLVNNKGAVNVKLSALNQIILDLGASSNEVILNTFVYCTGIGFHFKDGAKNFFAVNLSADQAQTGIKVSGNTTGQIISPLLWGREDQVVPYRGYQTDLGVNPAENHYFVSYNDFSGNVKIFGPLNQGNSKGSAYDLYGSGKISLSGALIAHAGKPAIIASVNSLSTYGLVFDQPQNDSKYYLNSGAKNIEIIGNITSDDKGALYNLVNNAGINYTVVEPNTTCKLNVSINTPEWQKTSLSNTTVNTSSATTTVCGLPISSGTMEYNTSCNASKKATVSGGCATISLNACNSRQTLNYRLSSGGSTSGWDSVSNIGAYLVIAQVYNKFLYPGSPAENNASNIGFHIARMTTLSGRVRDIGEIATKVRQGENNTTFMQYLYRGIIGREADSVGLSYWINQLNSGTSRNTVLNGFVDSNEAKIIYSVWGYN